MSDIEHGTSLIIRNQQTNKKQIENYLAKIDAANFIANIGVGIGSLVVQDSKGVQMSSREALMWMAESRASIGGNLATAAISAPATPQKNWKFYVRHGLGPWNPSYWVTVWEAVKTALLI